MTCVLYGYATLVYCTDTQLNLQYTANYECETCLFQQRKPESGTSSQEISIHILAHTNRQSLRVSVTETCY